MTRVKLVHHINVQITDRQRTREWYELVLGATFLDRGEALNKRQLQLNLGNAEIHFSETSSPNIADRVHFALEVEDWEETLAHLDACGVNYSRSGSGAFRQIGMGSSDRWAMREDNGEHYTYIHDPDGNLIELVNHPLGLVDSSGQRVDISALSQGVRWRQLPETELALGKV